MPKTLFYAWQSDLPNSTNRSVIRSAIDDALKEVNAELDIEDAIRPDQDTQDVPGTPTVADVIFEKIDACSIFVPDISIVTPKDATRPMSNPNVLIEYGRATKAVGDGRIVTVFNEAFGDWENDRAFDLRHKRKPLLYRLPEEHSSDERKAERARLGKQIASAIRAIIDNDGLAAEPSSFPGPEAFSVMRERYFDLIPSIGETSRLLGFWIGLRPVVSLTLDRPFEHPDLFGRFPTFTGRFPNTESPLEFNTMDNLWSGSVSESSVKPGLPYSERRWERSMKDYKAEDICLVIIGQDGSVGLFMRTNYMEGGPHLSSRWIMADVANALRNADGVRGKTSRANAEYSLVLEIRYDHQFRGEIKPAGQQWRLGLLPDENPTQGVLMPDKPRFLGPYRVGPASDFPSVLGKVLADLYIAAGRPPEDQFVFDELPPLAD